MSLFPTVLFSAEEPQWKGLPLFLYGDSMGGAVAIQAHRRAPQMFDGAVLVAPMCKVVHLEGTTAGGMTAL